MEQERSFNNLSENDKTQDRAWTVDEIRKNSSNWTLAGDIGLFNLLNEFAHHIISRTHEVENSVDSLVHQTKMASAKINNIINDFHMLSNLQFVENRVYDEEVQEPTPEEKPVEKTKEQKEAEMLPKIIKAVELGLTVLDKAFDRINVNEISDSEDEDISSEGRTILEPKDPYEHRPLPFIIGSEEFQKSDYAGLHDLLEQEIESSVEEASSISESDESSSEEEPLPLDDKFSEKQSIRRLSQSISDKMSSSEESELFGSDKEDNGFVSDSSFETKTKEGKNIQLPNTEVKAKEKESRQNSISSLQSKLNLPQVLPVPKLQPNKIDDDLFMNDEEVSDDDSPFRKRTGLFASEARFDDEKDTFSGDLFTDSISQDKADGKQKNSSPVIKKKESPVKKAPVTRSTKPVLFDQDEDSEDDIFNSIVKIKKPAVPIENNESQDSPEKAESSSTPSSAPSLKPSGNAFDFVTGTESNTLFGDESDADDLFSSKKTSKKFDFDSLEDDDLFGGVSQKQSKPAEVPSKNSEKVSLFEDSIDQSSRKAEKSSAIKVSKMAKDSLFGDSDSSDQEVQPSIIQSQLSVPEKKKEISLFDDDDDDDIFTQINKKKPVSTKPSSLNKNLGESLFDSVPNNTAQTKEVIKEKKEEKLSLFGDKQTISPSKETVKEKKDEPGLFNDKKTSTQAKGIVKEKKDEKLSLFDDKEEKLASSVPSKIQKKGISLFEDSDNFDLFSPKTTEKKAEPKISNIPPKDSLLKTSDESDSNIFSTEISNIAPKHSLLKTSDQSDGSIFSTQKSTAKTPENITQVGFDVPVDSSKTLNVINKDRAKIVAKRRKPTRKGRLANLENTDKKSDVTGDSSEISESIVSDSKTEQLFPSVTTAAKASERPPLSYKVQEKKKMNLMSQLISEVAASKVGKKTVIEDNDDDVDIFAETLNQNKSKTQSFTFLSPEESNIDSVFPKEKTEDKSASAETNTVDPDNLENDFFTEPSFHNFRSSISRKDSPLNLDDDDDDDDDLFSTIKNDALPKVKAGISDSDIFDDETDIFADIQREKYEMFPSQLYDNEDDDIFGNLDPSTSDKTSNIANKSASSSAVKKVEKKQVDAFEDPLTGLLGDD